MHSGAADILFSEPPMPIREAPEPLKDSMTIIMCFPPDETSLGILTLASKRQLKPGLLQGLRVVQRA